MDEFSNSRDIFSAVFSGIRGAGRDRDERRRLTHSVRFCQYPLGQSVQASFASASLNCPALHVAPTSKTPESLR